MFYIALQWNKDWRHGPDFWPSPKIRHSQFSCLSMCLRSFDSYIFNKCIFNGTLFRIRNCVSCPIHSNLWTNQTQLVCVELQICCILMNSKLSANLVYDNFCVFQLIIPGEEYSNVENVLGALLKVCAVKNVIYRKRRSVTEMWGEKKKKILYNRCKIQMLFLLELSTFRHCQGCCDSSH